MRIALAIAVAFACPLAAAAQDAGDRYGPWSSARVQSAADAQGPAYEGRILSWSNKQAPQPPAPPEDEPRAPNRPEPMALTGQFSRQGGALPPAPAVYRAAPQGGGYLLFQPQVPLPMQQASTRPASPAPARAAPAPSARPLPASLYDAPAAKPELLGGPPPRPQARPQQAAALAPTPIPAPTPTPGVGGATRYYSVHRGYGLTPDAIPEPPAGNRYVLIGPPDGAPEPKPKSDDTDDTDDAPAGRPAF